MAGTSPARRYFRSARMAPMGGWRRAPLPDYRGDAMEPSTPSRLERARRRVDSSTPYSPEWQAAIEELEEAEAEITCVTGPRHADERDLFPAPGRSLGDAA
jgi:hypothetical protein